MKHVFLCETIDSWESKQHQLYALQPEALNLLTIYSDLKKQSLEKTLQEVNNKDFSYLKKQLADLLIETICPIGKKIKDLKKDKTYLTKALKEGTEKAASIAEKNLKEVKEIVGFL